MGVFEEIVDVLFNPFRIAACAAFGALVGHNIDNGDLAWAGFYAALLAILLIQFVGDQFD